MGSSSLRVRFLSRQGPGLRYLTLSGLLPTRRLHLIDHGSALYVHHSWQDPDAHARRPFVQIRDHVLLPFAGSIADADARLAPRLDRAVLEAMAASIPDGWLPAEAGLPDPDAHRRAYVEYLLTRLEARQAFVEEADHGRAA